MKISELIDPKIKAVLSPIDNGILIDINDMKFQVVLQYTNIYWGIVPKTGTKNKIDTYRKNNRSGIMKILIPALKKAIKQILTTYEPKLVTIDSNTMKGRKLYWSWKQIHPLYKILSTNQGITLIKE